MRECVFLFPEGVPGQAPEGYVIEGVTDGVEVFRPVREIKGEDVEVVELVLIGVDPGTGE